MSEQDKLIADAMRYRWIRENTKTKDGLVLAQSLLWNSAPERKRLDKAIDAEIKAKYLRKIKEMK